MFNFRVGFCSVIYGYLGFGSGSCTCLISGSDSVRFLTKPGFWFGSFLLGSCSFPSLVVGYCSYDRYGQLTNDSAGVQSRAVTGDGVLMKPSGEQLSWTLRKNTVQSVACTS